MTDLDRVTPWLRHHGTCARIREAGACDCGLNVALEDVKTFSAARRARTVLAGDTIWFSIELLRQMLDDAPRTVLLSLKAIRTDDDGTKMLVLERVSVN